MVQKQQEKNKLDKIEAHLMNNPNITVIGKKMNSEFRGNEGIVQETRFFVAPKSAQYNVTDLQRTLMGLEPPDLKSASIHHVLRDNKDGIVGGILTFHYKEETIPSKQIFRIDDSALRFSLLDSTALKLDENGVATIEKEIEIFRFIWVRLYPDEESARMALDNGAPYERSVKIPQIKLEHVLRTTNGT